MTSRAVAAIIYALYETILGRSPDALSYEYWTAQREGGASLDAIAGALLASPEFTSANGPYTQGSDQNFIGLLYQNALDRAPDASGLVSFESALAGGASQASVAVDIATSQEARNDLAPTLQARVFVPDQTDAEIARLYYALVGLAPGRGRPCPLGERSRQRRSAYQYRDGFHRLRRICGEVRPPGQYAIRGYAL